jgi:hypothetical protein
MESGELDLGASADAILLLYFYSWMSTVPHSEAEGQAEGLFYETRGGWGYDQYWGN